MNHWVVLEQCGPDTQLTIVAILDMGGVIPPSIISMAIGEMGAFFTNLQGYMHADENQENIQKIVSAAQTDQVAEKGDNRNIAQAAVELASRRSDDMLNNGWGTSKPISGGVAMMSRKPVPGVAIDPVRCIGYIRNTNADKLKCIMMNPTTKKALSEMTPSPMLLFDRMETHRIEFPRVDLKQYVRSTPAPAVAAAEEEEQHDNQEDSHHEHQQQMTVAVDEQGHDLDAVVSPSTPSETPMETPAVAKTSKADEQASAVIHEPMQPLPPILNQTEHLPEPTAYNTPTGLSLPLSADQLDAFRKLLDVFPRQRAHTLLRWLAASDYDAEAAATELRKHLEWKSENLPVDINLEASLVLGDNPVIIRLGLASDGSAIVKIAAKLLPPPTEESIELCTQAVIWAVESCLRVSDKLSVVYDRSGDVSTSTELDYAKPIVATLESQYPETLSGAFLFPIGGAFRLGKLCLR